MFRLFSLTIICIALIFIVESAADEKYITGKITHNQPNNIDTNAKVEVTLRDVSLIDTASTLISSTTINDAKTFPVSYTLKYNPSDIKPHYTYAVSVQINGPDGKLLFINDVQTLAVLTGSTTTVVDVPVIKIGGSSSNTETKVLDKKVCGLVKCPGGPKKCPYGYQKKDGCEICRCNDPCNPPGKPILCGPKQRCFVDKKPDGTFTTFCDTLISYNSKVICNQPKVVGSCEAYMPRYFYNSLTKNCESFIYGGCHGNRNNFNTTAECEKVCKA